MKRGVVIRRSPMPVRRTPLRRTELRRTPLVHTGTSVGAARAGGKVAAAASRLRAGRGARILPDAVAVVKKRSGGLCEIGLPGCWGNAVERSHRIARGAGGVHGEAKALSDRPSDLLDTCIYCHLLITRYAWRPDVRAKVHGWVLTRDQEPTETKVLYRGEWKHLDDAGGCWSPKEAGA